LGSPATQLMRAVSQPPRAEGLIGDIERDPKGLIQLAGSVGWQHANVVGKVGLGNADQGIAVDAAVVLQALVGTDGDLCRQSIVAGVDWRANDRRELGIDQDLSAHHDENALAFGVARRVFDEKELAAFHTVAW
ncbi:MAG TPA: hypothetical protein PLC98_25080, partial [Anaerolineales bacterium]|nr:hypothetical protein [Anaerolineales bacterium]